MLFELYVSLFKIKMCEYITYFKQLCPWKIFHKSTQSCDLYSKVTPSKPGSGCHTFGVSSVASKVLAFQAKACPS